MISWWRKGEGRRDGCGWIQRVEQNIKCVCEFFWSTWFSVSLRYTLRYRVVSCSSWHIGTQCVIGWVSILCPAAPLGLIEHTSYTISQWKFGEIR